MTVMMCTVLFSISSGYAARETKPNKGEICTQKQQMSGVPIGMNEAIILKQKATATDVYVYFNERLDGTLPL